MHGKLSFSGIFILWLTFLADKRVQRTPFKKGCRMKPVLIIEIVSALVALGALATLLVQAVRAKLKSGRGPVLSCTL